MIILLASFMCIIVTSSSETPKLQVSPVPPNANETLIWIGRYSSNQNYTVWANILDEYLKKYYTARGDTIKSCNYENYPASGEVCDVDTRSWGDCMKEQYYNYHKSSPCVFLELTKVPGWTPQHFDDPNNLPDDMPDNLKEHIKSIQNVEERKNVWVSCQGDWPVDVELLGNIEYKSKGFPGYYFPYNNQKGYLNPLVAVRFLKPMIGVVINVECTAWAKNLNNGIVNFELLLD